VVDADDAHAHAAGAHLGGDVAEAAAGAEEDDEVAGLGGGFAEGGVDCYACAEPVWYISDSILQGREDTERRRV